MQKFIKPSELFKSSDLNLTAFLSCHGYHISSFEKQANNETTFCIERDENLDKLTQLYFSNQATVNPSLFAYHQKQLKNAIYHS